MYETDRRPSVVTTAAVILYVTSGLGLIGAFVLLGSDLLTDLGQTLIWITIIILVVDIVLATKILGGSNGARITIIVLASIDIGLTVITGLEGLSILGIGLKLLIIGLLAWNRDAQDYFRGERRLERADYRIPERW